jgi:Spy/CpxP family protein refolding chaperone
MMKKFAGIALSMILVVASYAQGFGPGGFPPPGPGFGGGLPLQGLLEELDLTPAQQQQVRQILDANQSGMRSAQLAGLKAQKALDDAVTANPGDQATISVDAAALGAALGQLAITRAEIESQVSAILTSTQKQKLAEERQRLDDRLTKLIERLSTSS